MPISPFSTLPLVLTLVLTAVAHAEPAKPELGSLQTFVACPIYRDTDLGRKSGCWLADHPESGVRYDVTWAPIKPQQGREILVEGIVTDEVDACGGVVLEPVRVAVLPSTCPRVKLEAESFPGRASPPPTEVLAPTSVPRSLPPPPYTTRAFDIYFEFGRDFLIYQHAEVVIERVLLYARASHARSVRIEGFAATAPLTAAERTLSEPASLGEARARMVALALRRLGLPERGVEIVWSGSPATTDLEGGRLPESSKRRVTITVTP